MKVMVRSWCSRDSVLVVDVAVVMEGHDSSDWMMVNVGGGRDDSGSYSGGEG